MEIKYVKNENGPVLGLAKIGVIEKDGLFFKDMDATGELKPFEDWRLPAAARAKDLAARLSIEEIAGLMLYSAHQSIPARGMRHFRKGIRRIRREGVGTHRPAEGISGAGQCAPCARHDVRVARGGGPLEQ